ncbi:hypothetical protein K1T71_001423 [Dendrolimus kikuchii]|uniref:Uncharacterized protein n=1 Tax=Dendrolimus kikuchii TaxID=765133 RepID=A0ACC1DIK6_9NEOP|nr:hypothetical protein K1T71_001423 [Dendrolimus kikuchii]
MRPHVYIEEPKRLPVPVVVSYRDNLQQFQKNGKVRRCSFQSRPYTKESKKQTNAPNGVVQWYQQRKAEKELQKLYKEERRREKEYNKLQEQQLKREIEEERKELKRQKRELEQKGRDLERERREIEKLKKWEEYQEVEQQRKREEEIAKIAEQEQQNKERRRKLQFRERSAHAKPISASRYVSAKRSDRTKSAYKKCSHCFFRLCCQFYFCLTCITVITLIIIL